MRETVYLETSIIGYATSRPSRDLVTAAHQHLTREWWRDERGRYDCFVSQTVVNECARGDQEAAAERLEAVREIPLLDVPPRAEELADLLLRTIPLPQVAQVDALHIATATVNEMDYLLTWNCAHIANPALLPRILEFSGSMGLKLPIICMPQQLIHG